MALGSCGYASKIELCQYCILATAVTPNLATGHFPTAPGSHVHPHLVTSAKMKSNSFEKMSAMKCEI